MEIKMEKIIVEAKSRQLSGEWTFETPQTISILNMDVEVELMAILCAEYGHGKTFGAWYPRDYLKITREVVEND